MISMGRKAGLRTRLGIVLAANLASGVSVWLLIPVVGPSAGAIGFLPALLAGWLFGWRTGALLTLLTQLFTSTAFVLRGDTLIATLIVIPFVLPITAGSAAASGAVAALLDRTRAERDQLAREIARREKAEAALAAAREAAERAERLSSLGVLVAGVAHEINNPLAYMRGNTELALLSLDDLAERDDLPADVRAEIETLRSGQRASLAGVDRVEHIARSLKRFASTQQGPRERHDLRELVDSALMVARPHFGPDVAVVTRTEAAAAVVNENEVVQIVTNLLLNASQAMGSAGTLSIRTAREGDEVVLAVSDTGPGIAPEDMHKIFTPFHTTKPEGTGLGLSLSYRIAADHGGGLEFASEPGKGTTFSLRLPAAAPERRVITR